jgi:5-methylcytosine-specific restriction endonuclease McrA
MSMNRALYPDNWEEIALEVKIAANWRCQACTKHCLEPHQVYEAHKANISAWATYTLTVHHIDHVPANCDRTNLIALCAPCHRRQHAHDKRYGKPNTQQLSLIG